MVLEQPLTQQFTQFGTIWVNTMGRQLAFFTDVSWHAGTQAAETGLTHGCVRGNDSLRGRYVMLWQWGQIEITHVNILHLRNASLWLLLLHPGQ